MVYQQEAFRERKHHHVYDLCQAYVQSALKCYYLAPQRTKTFLCVTTYYKELLPGIELGTPYPLGHLTPYFGSRDWYYFKMMLET